MQENKLNSPGTFAIILAAGTGQRFASPLPSHSFSGIAPSLCASRRSEGSKCSKTYSGQERRHTDANGKCYIPKQYQKIGNKPIILHTIEAFIKNQNIEKVIVVINKEHQKFYKEAIGDFISDLIHPVFGGDIRQQSVRYGLKAIAHLNPQKVIIHDAARPFVTDRQINDVISALDEYDIVDSVLPVTDTIRMIEGADFKTLDRDTLYKVQTPQGFIYSVIASIHEKFSDSYGFTDDVGMCLGFPNIGVVEGDRANIKITYKEDMMLTNTNIVRTVRTGIGFDVHRFSNDICETTIPVCGIHIPHNKKVEAHSDGDVGLHALTEAILGSIAEGNIGTHFPPQDSQWKNADSKIFVSHANNLLKSKSGAINNIDVTIICEAPKIMIHSLKMRQNIADLLSISLDQVSVKATTTEKMGFLGRKEGIAAQAICTISIPPTL